MGSIPIIFATVIEKCSLPWLAKQSHERGRGIEIVLAFAWDGNGLFFFFFFEIKTLKIGFPQMRTNR